MAYAERMPGRNRTLVIATVAGLHGMALYGLVTGLGVDYVERLIPGITGTNIPLDPPPPPPPEPSAQANESSRDVSTITAPRPALTVPRTHVDPIVPTELVNIRLDPIVPPAERIDLRPTPASTGMIPRAVQPRNDRAAWVTTQDYPAAALRRGEAGTVRFELAVSADGKVADCRVTGSSGSAELDAATCRNVTRRARFEPATDASGERVAGTYTGTVRWVVPQD